MKRIVWPLILSVVTLVVTGCAKVETDGVESDTRRYAIVYHLLSTRTNRRLMFD